MIIFALIFKLNVMFTTKGLFLFLLFEFHNDVEIIIVTKSKKIKINIIHEIISKFIKLFVYLPIIIFKCHYIYVALFFWTLSYVSNTFQL